MPITEHPEAQSNGVKHQRNAPLRRHGCSRTTHGVAISNAMHYVSDHPMVLNLLAASIYAASLRPIMIIALARPHRPTGKVGGGTGKRRRKVEKRSMSLAIKNKRSSAESTV